MKTRIIMLGLLLVTAIFTGAAQKPARPQQHTDIHARYFFAAETAYQEIVIEGLKLKLTTFNDLDQRCKNWMAQQPCWTQQDLQTREASLSKKDLTDFVNLINQSGFLLLDKTQGGAKDGQRFYSQTLKVKLGDVQHEVIYQSFPDAAPQPQAFTKVSKWLSQLVQKKFHVNL